MEEELVEEEGEWVDLLLDPVVSVFVRVAEIRLTMSRVYLATSKNAQNAEPR